MSGRRAVVTGLGIVSPVGIGNEVAWSSLLAGQSGIVEIDRFDITDYDHPVGGQVPSFDPTVWMEPKDIRRHDLSTQFAVAAAGEALTDAGLLGPDRLLDTGAVNPDRFGMVFGSGIGGIGLLLENHQVLLETGPKRVKPYLIPHMLPDSPSGMVAIAFGIRGHNMAVVSACATGGHAIGEAMEAIVRGQADLMLGAGTEAPLLGLAFAGFGNMGGLGTPFDPDTGEYSPPIASRPFDATRNGFVVSEGSAVLVLEELEHARARGAHVYAEVVGYGSSADAFHMAIPSELGEGNSRAMQAALDRASIGPDEVDYINPHGTGTKLNDLYETAAIRRVFGDHADKLAVSSTKSMTGHLMGAAGAVEGWVCVQAIRHGMVPPTINLTHPDPDLTLDYVPLTARSLDVRVALSNALGLGGHNSSVIFRRVED